MIFVSNNFVCQRVKWCTGLRITLLICSDHHTYTADPLPPPCLRHSRSHAPHERGCRVVLEVDGLMVDRPNSNQRPRKRERGLQTLYLHRYLYLIYRSICLSLSISPSFGRGSGVHFGVHFGAHWGLYFVGGGGDCNYRALKSPRNRTLY